MENGKWKRAQKLRSGSLPGVAETPYLSGVRLNYRETDYGISYASCRGMPKSRDLRVRGFEFTVAIVEWCRSDLGSDPVIRRLGFQLVDAAGSVGANLEESGAGQSKADFVAKQFVALKEAREAASG